MHPKKKIKRFVYKENDIVIYNRNLYKVSDLTPRIGISPGTLPLIKLGEENSGEIFVSKKDVVRIIGGIEYFLHKLVEDHAQILQEYDVSLLLYNRDVEKMLDNITIKDLYYLLMSFYKDNNLPLLYSKGKDFGGYNHWFFVLNTHIAGTRYIIYEHDSWYRPIVGLIKTGKNRISTDTKENFIKNFIKIIKHLSLTVKDKNFNPVVDNVDYFVKKLESI